MSMLPTTSYGYAPPSDALATGWWCPVCARTEEPAPRTWPFVEPVEDAVVVGSSEQAVAEAAKAVARSVGRASVLAGVGADAVLGGLGGRAVVHFGSPAQVDFADPGRSGVVVADGLLTMQRLASAPLERTLAYLSACRVILGSGQRLDDAVHVGAAFQLAGFPQVIATMWPVGDRAAQRFARLTYEALRGDPDPARAIHHTVRTIRELLPDRPSVWAALAHFGR